MAFVALGEGMLELTGSGLGPATLGYGGDTLNTAIYLARLGLPVRYLTALGTDPFSHQLRAAWAGEGLGLDLVLTHPTRLPGLYAIHTRPDGERSFSYWRSDSAARALFDCPDSAAALDQAAKAQCLYLSGITLSLFDDAGRAKLGDLCAAVRAQGGRIGFDPNYRPRGWPDADTARAAFAAIAPVVDIAFPTLEDEALLGHPTNAEALAQRWLDRGAQECVVKLGAEGAFVACAQGQALVRQSRTAAARDTTGAGDSFNAAYLAARLGGADPFAAAAAGNALASHVVEHPGAVIPSAAMPPRPAWEPPR